MTTAQRIAKLREEKGYSQLEFAKVVKINNSVMNRIERGLRPVRDDELVAIANCLGVSTDYILTGRVLDGGHGVKIPVLGRVVAGIPINAVQEIIDYEEIPESLARDGNEYFALQVKGKSMEPRILDGDVVIVRKQPTVENGEIAIILVNGNEATVKEVKESTAGVTLIGHNVAVYSPTFYSNTQIEELPVRILGKVVEMRRKF